MKFKFQIKKPNKVQNTKTKPSVKPQLSTLRSIATGEDGHATADSCFFLFDIHLIFVL